MMALKIKLWDAADVLKTPADIAAYLDAYLEDGTAEELRMALNTIARSHGMTALARKTVSAEKRYIKRLAIRVIPRSIPCCGL